jgi:hypothetical protein
MVSRCTESESGGRMIDAILTNTVLPRIAMNEQWAQANKPEDALYYREVPHWPAATRKACSWAGNAVGAVLAFGPQAVSDARAAGNGSEFAKLSMQNQASNLVGFGAGVAVGIIGGAVAAPAVVVFVAALGIGIAAQAVFSSSGAEQSWKSAVDGWFQ